MTRLPLTALLLAASLAGAMPAHADASITAAQLGEIFCIGRLSTEMAPLETLLTADLARRVADAEAKNAAFIKAHPDAKAPLADGIPWQSNPAYARECQMVGMSGTADVPLAVIAYGYEDSTQNFSDRLELNFVGGKLRLDNVDYGNGGDLKSRLAAAFKN